MERLLRAVGAGLHMINKFEDFSTTELIRKISEILRRTNDTLMILILA